MNRTMRGGISNAWRKFSTVAVIVSMGLGAFLLAVPLVSDPVKAVENWDGIHDNGNLIFDISDYSRLRNIKANVSGTFVTQIETADSYMVFHHDGYGPDLIASRNFDFEV